MEEEKFGAGPKEPYEIAGAITVTIAAVLVILALIGVYALLESFIPAKVTLVEGKITVLADPTVLARSLVMKIVGVLTGLIALMWTLLGLNHLLPGDGLREIQHHANASAIFYGAVVVFVFYIFCFG